MPDSRRTFLTGLMVPLFGTSISQARSQAEQTPNPAALVEEFFGRLNALDDWFISLDGKENNTAVVDRFMELFSSDSHLQVGPSKNQLGAVTYRGIPAIRKWADQFSRSYLDLNYRIDFKTRQNQTAKPVYTFEMPWGDAGVAVQFTAVWTNRNDRKRFWMPGAAFFLFDRQEKITEVRLYMLRDEAEETKTYVGM